MLTLRNTVTADVDMKDILSKMNDSQPLVTAGQVYRRRLIMKYLYCKLLDSALIYAL